MTVNQFQSLKSFVANHPPLVVFTLCIIFFGITTAVLAFIVGRSDLPNPDITMDWNVFLSHLTQRSLCVQVRNISLVQKSHANDMKNAGSLLSNKTTNATAATTSGNSMGVEELSLSELLPDLSSLKMVQAQKGPSINVTRSMVVPLSFDDGLLQLPPAVTWLRGSVTGRHVGYTGQLSKEIIHVNMFLPKDVTQKKKARAACQQGSDCRVRLNVCVVFFGASTVMPDTRQLPGCRHWNNDVKGAANTTWYLPEFAAKQCADKTRMNIQYQPNPSLTVMLTNIDRSLVNLHLMHTSYLIFIVVVTMLCYALVRSHFRNTRILSSEKVNV